LTNGFVGPTRDILVDDGIPYVQSTHIKGGLIDFQRRPFYVTREWHRQRPRIHLREGDVLIVQTGDIGQVAVVPKEFGEASCHALQIARVKADVISGDYLGGYLRTAFGKHSLLCRATGALHPHLEGSIRSVPIVVPPASVQAEVVHEVEGAHATLVSLQGHVHRQIELLGERKRALITSAVTGEFDLTTASGRGVRMTIPDFQTLMLPILKAVGDGRPVPRRELADAMITEFSLTEAEREKTISSGDKVINNRTWWALTHLFQAGLLARPQRGVVEITDAGRALLAQPPLRIDVAYLDGVPAIRGVQKQE